MRGVEPDTRDAQDAQRRFRRAYAEQRAAEGRGDGGAAELLALPYLHAGPTARAWGVRARTFERFLDVVIAHGLAHRSNGALRILDVGAGNGWLSYRLTRMGHRATAIDIRDDHVDGLGAAGGYAAHLDTMFERAAASFEHLPFRSATFDIVVFNASLHYAQRLADVLSEAARVARTGGRIVILDSPFYATDAAGAAMVAEKHARAGQQFGARAADLLGVPAIEYLTRDRLERATAGLSLSWRRHAVRYPLWYRVRPLLAALRRRRSPSRFDLWEANVS
jgi:SAM-dependent methyltransferase